MPLSTRIFLKIIAAARNQENSSALDHQKRKTNKYTITACFGPQKQVFEMTHSKISARESQNGILLQTNHFIDPQSAQWDVEPIRENSLKRYERLVELSETIQDIDITTIKSILQDRIDPWTGLESPVGTFDDGNSLATNGALFGVIFLPQKRHFYVASGQIPVPEQPWYSFSLYELFGLEDPQG